MLLINITEQYNEDDYARHYTYTNNFGNNMGTASSNPHQRIRALKDMISSLESSIGALSNGEGAPMWDI